MRRAEVAAVLAAGRRLRGPSINVQIRVNGLGLARLGLIVPKRHVRRAVDRNRMKRLLREWFRHYQERLQGSDLLIRVIAPVPDPECAIRDMNRLFCDER